MGGAQLSAPPREGLRVLLGVGLGHLLITFWLFPGPFLPGRLLFFRDLFAVFAPNFVVLARAFAEHIWPLWNSFCDGGGPFLMGYPVDLLLVLLAGARAPVGIGVSLHFFLALCGGSVLARRMNMGPWAAWCVGAIYGLSGYVLSSVNLLPLFEAVAWVPWVLASWLSFLEKPSWRRAAILAIFGALQVSTLGGEIVVQTALAGLLLAPDWKWLRDRRLPQLVGAAALTLLATAPVWLGVRAILAGTARGRGFVPAEVLQYSIPPTAFGEALVPKLLGNVHGFTPVEYWGVDFFPQGYPYLLSLYLGVVVLLLAVRAGFHLRLCVLAVVGVLLGLGSYGPVAGLVARALFVFRGPQKFFLLTTLAVALLAGFGQDRSLRGPRTRLSLVLLLPGVALVALALCLPHHPDLVSTFFSPFLPRLAEPSVLANALSLWSREWLAVGSLAMAAAGAIFLGGGWARLAGVLAVLDLLIVNGALNPLTDPRFYDLQPAVRKMIDEAAGQGVFRWFAYGASNTQGVRWEPFAIRSGSDFWLYSGDRQSLLPRTQALDGLEGAFDADLAGWAPEGSTLQPWEVSPARYAEHHARLRLGNVRWVLSFTPLPSDLVLRRSEAKLDEIRDPLVLYELRDPLPRVFWVPRHEVIADKANLAARLNSPDFDPRQTVLLSSEPPLPSRPAARVDPPPPDLVYERLDAHTLRIRGTSPPGYVVVLDGYHPDWQVSGPTTALLRANGRYVALVAPGGACEWVLNYRPPWRGPALALSGLGVLCILWLLRPTPSSR